MSDVVKIIDNDNEVLEIVDGKLQTENLTTDSKLDTVNTNITSTNTKLDTTNTNITSTNTKLDTVNTNITSTLDIAGTVDNNPITDYDVAMASGLIENHRAQGFSALGTSATSETIVSAVGLALEYPFLATADNIGVASTSVQDVLGGTGAYQILIGGLDENYVEVTEILELTGQTPVYTTAKLLRVNGIAILAFNNVATLYRYPDGTIWAGTGTFTAGVPAVKLRGIATTENRCRDAIYTIPDGNLGVFKSAILGSAVSAQTNIFVTIYVKLFGENFIRKLAPNIINKGFTELKYIPPVVIPPKTDIFVTTESEIGTHYVDVTIIMDLNKIY